MPVTINGDGSITGLSVGGLPNGSVNADTIAANAVTDAKISAMAASKLTGALPAISGAALTGLTAGMSDFDEWYITSNITGNQTPYTSWARANTASNHHGIKGGTMSHSSGTWTFPSTGYWFVSFQAWVFNQNRLERNAHFQIFTTSDNSSYENPAAGSIGHTNFSGSGNGATHQSAHCQFIFDVQDTSTHKMQFRSSMTDQSSTTMGGRQYSRFVVIKIAET